MTAGDFEWCAGSVIGRDHLQPLGWKNNQDSVAIRSGCGVLVAVVADGCGAEPKSEVGAAIGAAIVAESLYREYLLFGGREGCAAIFSRVRSRALMHIRMAAHAMGQDFTRMIYDHFLFTVNGVVVAREETTLFAIGDGIQMVNGESIPLGKYENNSPSYLAYTALSGADDRDPANDFRITKTIPTGEVRSLLIGSDGVHQLAAIAAECIPGRQETIGPISQFWEDDRYFQNPDMVRRHLALIQREWCRIDWQERSSVRVTGKLADDTTLVAVRRARERR